MCESHHGLNAPAAGTSRRSLLRATDPTTGTPGGPKVALANPVLVRTAWIAPLLRRSQLRHDGAPGSV